MSGDGEPHGESDFLVPIWVSFKSIERRRDGALLRFS